ncbi:four helix bundle protein [bacterium]|nr:four helix bundle protein [bacterium]
MVADSGSPFDDLAIYQAALQFVMAVYGLVAVIPRNDVYGLATLMKQAAVGITTNIGKSSKKKTREEKTRYLNLALDAIEECRYFLNFVEEVGYAATMDLKRHLDQVRSMLADHAASI